MVKFRQPSLFCLVTPFCAGTNWGTGVYTCRVTNTGTAVEMSGTRSDDRPTSCQSEATDGFRDRRFQRQQEELFHVVLTNETLCYRYYLSIILNMKSIWLQLFANYSSISLEDIFGVMTPCVLLWRRPRYLHNCVAVSCIQILSSRSSVFLGYGLRKLIRSCFLNKLIYTYYVCIGTREFL